jgi:hypothetical protein
LSESIRVTLPTAIFSSTSSDLVLPSVVKALMYSFLTLASRIFSNAKRIFSAFRRAASSAATIVDEPVDEAFDAELLEEASVRAALAPEEAELSLESIEMLSEKAESLSGLSVLIPSRQPTVSTLLET